MEMRAATAVSEPDGTTASGGATYRPHLDGLRALAVYLVLLFHAGSSWFPGGYVGVDVFFVLSGFLVTQLLLRDIVARDSIRFGRFYSRRFRRLLPAAFVALMVTAVVYTAIASPAEVLAAVGSFKAAFLYSTNWYFVHQSTNYFGADVTTSPVLHFWSLAVEEQFYLLWPLLLGGAFVVTRRMDPARRTRTIAIAVAIGALASAAWALSLRSSDPNRAYYGTDTRAYELLAGALLALVPASVVYVRRYRRIAKLAAVAAVGLLLIVASSWLHLDAIERGIAITLITCVGIVALEAADGGVAKRLLSTPTAVYLGKISYGTYLWHWLVILVAIRTFHLSALSTIGVSALVATALAALSYEILEHPIRASRFLDGHRRVVIATGLAVSVIAALVLIPTVVDPARAEAPTAASSTLRGFTPVPANLDWRGATSGNGAFPSCLHQAADKCAVAHGTRGGILLIGDSHARMFVPTFTEIARREHLTLWVTVDGACPWQRDLYARPLGGIGVKSVCKARKDDVYDRLLRALKPDIVVAVNLGYEDPALVGEPFLDQAGHVLTHRDADYYRWPEATTTRSVDAIRTSGAKLVIVEPIPIASTINPLTCLSAAKVLESCRYTARAQLDPLERFYQGVDHRYTDVWAANFDRLVCPFLPICDPIVNGEIVKIDRTHLTDKFAKTLATPIDDYLKESGILTAGPGA
jgi:peptidoglycan/LPS O-acetylase OafA/YrhL